MERPPTPVTLLDVRVTERDDGSALYFYRLHRSGRLEHDCSVEVSQPRVGSLSERLAAARRDEIPEERLTEHAHALYRALFPYPPGREPDLLARLRTSPEPVLVRTNETVVPWELLHDGTGFLPLTRDLERFPDGRLLGDQLPVPDAAVREMLDRAFDLAAGRRLVTSSHLLLSLVTADGLRPVLAGRVGADRLAGIADRLRRTADRASAHGTGDPIMSDTVLRVMSAAERRAAERGRIDIGLEDVAEAFARIDGGTAARAVADCGVTPWRLLSAEEEPSLDRLDDGVRAALRVAHLLARAQGHRVVASYDLLLGFALTDGPALRAALSAQGGPGEAALEALTSGLDPHPGELSERTLGAVRRAADEAGVLRALLSDDESAAHALLSQLGVDVRALIRDLDRRDPARRDPDHRRPDPGSRRGG
ncbi:hypothetical protein GCM10009678_45110 [Actinomadura kijaniata]|uniref:Clp R domain-containing protein n=1 Tax=Actinomadura namibiensis TaxID=182080 RepID=A0A7W3LWZ0_ACTNM|nr:Clp protease N-terminal domain-containing protein [Actinomadura namibiensis]MBA8955740.1 hypothetical protein [Actinomadura namibiensis]